MKTPRRPLLPILRESEAPNVILRTPDGKQQQELNVTEESHKLLIKCGYKHVRWIDGRREEETE
jgi:hypothetical protein